MFFTCTALSLFFIPVFKWDREYFLKVSCCKSIFKVDCEKIKDINNLELISNVNNICDFCNSYVNTKFTYCLW